MRSKLGLTEFNMDRYKDMENDEAVKQGNIQIHMDIHSSRFEKFTKKWGKWSK